MSLLPFANNSRRAPGILLALGALAVVFVWWRAQPSPAQREYRRGKSLQEIGMTADAQNAFQQAIRLEPRYAPPYRALAEMAVAQKDNQSAIRWWKAYVARDPKARHAWCRLAQAEALSGLEKPALKDAEQELKLDPGCSRAHLAVGLLYARQGNTKLALDHLSVAARAYPDDLQVQMVYGKVLALSGENAQGEAILKRILEKNTSHAEPYLWLGYIFARRSMLPDDARQAENYLRHALLLQPDLPEANYELGRLLLQLRQPQEAVPLLQKAIAHKRHYVAALFSLGQAYTDLKRDADAKRALQVFQRESDLAAREKALLRSYVVNPNDIEIQLQLGRLEIERDEPKAALIFLQSARTAAPGDQRIQSALQEAEQMLAKKQADPVPNP